MQYFGADVYIAETDSVEEVSEKLDRRPECLREGGCLQMSNVWEMTREQFYENVTSKGRYTPEYDLDGNLLPHGVAADMCRLSLYSDQSPSRLSDHFMII